MIEPQPPAGYRLEPATPVTGPMHSPCHTGEFIKTELIDELKLTVTEAAEILDVSRAQLSRLLNEKAALTWDMAIKLEKAFGLNADLMMRMQNAHDAAEARKRRDRITVKRVFVPQN